MANLSKPSEVERFYYRKETPAANIAKVIICARKGQYDQALTKLNALIDQSPNNPYLYEMRGQFAFESGNSANAVRDLKKAVSLAPDALSIRLLCAQALFTSSSDNAQEALDQLNRITQDDPDNVMAWLLKVGAYRKLNQAGQADIAQAVSRAKRAQKSSNPKVKEQATMLLDDNRLCRKEDD